MLGLWRIPVDGGPEIRVLDSVHHYWWAGADAGIYFVQPRSAQPASALSDLNFYSFKAQTVAHVGSIQARPSVITPSIAASRNGRRLLVVQGDEAGSDLILVHSFR